MAKHVVIVVGHRNPDTDAVISAISFTYVLKKLGYEAKPYVAGYLQPETRIILQKTGLPMPELIEDVRVRVRDVMTRKVFFVHREEPVKKAIDIIVSRSIRSLPVVDEDLRVKGMFSVESFARRFIYELSNLRLCIENLPLKNFVMVSDSKIVVGSEEDVIKGCVYVAAMDLNTIIRRGGEVRGNIVVVGDRAEVIKQLIRLGVSMIVVTGGYVPDESILEDARTRQVKIVVSPHDTYTTLRLLDLSQPVELFAEEAVKVSEDMSIEELRNVMITHGVRSVAVVDEVGRLRGIVTRSDLVKDYRKRVALVDHNEFSQSVEGIEEAVIIAVVDHHRLGGDVKTHRPIIFRVEPVGSTNTIVWKMMKELGIEVPKNVAEAMMYAILSDTMLLKGYHTDDDINVLNEISRYVGIEIKQAMEFLRIAMSANEPSNPDDAIRRDLKLYEYRGVRFGIAQIITFNPMMYLSMVKELRKAMSRVMEEKALQFLVLMITDIVEEKSYLVVEGIKKYVEKALGLSLDSSYVEVKGLTSRKNQLLPAILKALEG